MGMIPSGFISDAALYALLEKDFILKTSTRKNYRILFYARFRDDIIMICDAQAEDIRELLDTSRTKAHPFKLKLESISSHGFQMLDVSVTLSCKESEAHYSCSFDLFTKPTSIWKPLSPESNHPLNVHLHWPLAQCQRIRSKFSCKNAGEAAVQEFKTRYESSFGIKIAERHKFLSPKLPTSWIVFTYSLCLAKARLSSLVSKCFVPPGLGFCRLRLSWRLGGKHLIHLLRTHEVQTRAR